MKLASKIAAALGLAATVVAAAPSYAADPYPSGMVKLVVPFSAGGGVDLMARVLAQHLPAKLKGTYIVENKPGASGNIANTFVAKAPPDGLTLLVTSNAMVINHAIDSKVQFHAVESYAPVIMIGSSPVVIVGRTGLPFKTLPEMLNYARANPGKLSYASCGNGGVHHIAGELLKKSAKVDILHVPYKGCADATTNVLGGQVDLAIVSINNVVTYMQSGKVVPFAITEAKRSPQAPQVPTVQESGIANYDLPGWYGLFAPAGTPKDVVAKLNTAVNQVLQMPEVKETLTKNYMDISGGPSEKFAATVKSDLTRFTEIAKSANIHVD
ncbi:Tripartite-type tricarboxylate transporter, receptor component TctC [Noviherbaspirillum humi]|uniref:Tripartite-type tricarboxylate transporter, receptor component TctC n=1 Tax=Noviherbaspirillum humi TaxID=1688639 RepID=A0A239LC21_9BURK|nr:tripartite tricarboxylate transporter substrate binding protein [Noviherbaspirillum humi]SNT27468.1 Tripartite-type tricarboxylate transporter, receptor component TctC [Noviherbaspirillum humi]